MNYAISHLSVVPVRSSASDKSEMVSQILFGEMVEILERKGKQWLKVRCIWDNYIGWVSAKQLQRVTTEEFESYQNNFAYSLELVQPASCSKYFIPLTMGAILPNYDGIQFYLNGDTYHFSGQALTPNQLNPSAELVIKIARKYLYAPYLWGGRSPFGIDCSGFIQIVFKIAGVNLQRDAYQQVEQGELIDFVEQAKPGDLIFFENTKNRINHVGILLPDQQIIHASGMVRIDKIDHFGIYNEEQNTYTHKLRVIKRVLTEQINNIEKQHKATDQTSKSLELFN